MSKQVYSHIKNQLKHLLTLLELFKYKLVMEDTDIIITQTELQQFINQAYNYATIHFQSNQCPLIRNYLHMITDLQQNPISLLTVGNTYSYIDNYQICVYKLYEQFVHFWNIVTYWNEFTIHIVIYFQI